MKVKEEVCHGFVVMGGGLTESCDLPSWVVSRIEYVLDSALINDAVIFSSCFSMNVAPKIKDGQILSEASVGYNYFLAKNKKCDIENIFVENFSHDSVGSIFFSCVVAEAAGLSKLTFVTSNFHEARVTQLVRFISPLFDISANTLAVPSDFYGQREGEARALELFMSSFKGVSDKNDFFLRLITKHSNYNEKYRSARLRTDISTY